MSAYGTEALSMGAWPGQRGIDVLTLPKQLRDQNINGEGASNDDQKHRRRRRSKSSSKVSAQRRARQLKKFFFTALFVLLGGAVTVLIALRMGSSE
jgi:hypothetical protein